MRFSPRATVGSREDRITAEPARGEVDEQPLPFIRQDDVAWFARLAFTD
jgi:hypothetical protein